MRKRLAGILVALVTANVNAACTQAQVVLQMPHVENSPAVQAERTAQKKPVNWKYENEQQWLVSNITSDLAEMLLFAKFKDRAAPAFAAKDITVLTKTIDLDAGKYDISVADVPDKFDSAYKLTITDYIWSTKTYEPFAGLLLKELSLQATPPSAAPEKFLTTLANGDMEAIIAENERVSKELCAHPLDGGLHEQAAMILTKFNIEEVAGQYTEDRPQLSRGCAHLTLARALQGGKLGRLGQLAEVSLELMSVRDGMVTARLETMQKEATDPIEKSWIRAMRIRATHDIRLFDEKDHTALELSQYVMRYANDRDAAQMMQYISGKTAPPMILLRILGSNNASVEMGHMIAPKVVPAELMSFLADYKAYRKTPATNAESIMEELNRLPKRCLNATDAGAPVLNVITWDDIAAFHCRHLINATSTEYCFLQYMYGVPDEAKRSMARTKKLLEKLYMRPQALLNCQVERDDKIYILQGCKEIQSNYPELMTSASWQQLRGLAKDWQAFEVDYPLPPEKWFDPALPMGTAYFFHSRSEFPNYKKDLATLTRLRDYCPYFYELDQDWAKAKYGEHPNAEQYAEAFAPILDFNLQALQVVATGAISDPDKFLPLEEKAAVFEPAVNFNLGFYCVLHNRPELAAKYFEKGVATVDNSVMVANQVDWLVRYRYEHGQKEKAKELANFCGEVYSQMGLLALANYQERSGDMAGAEETLKNIMERYDSKHEYAAFLIRNAATNKKYADESQKYIREFFPDGMKKVTVASFSGVPTKGQQITEGDMFAETSPLVKDVVIVALNGYQVDTRDQFYVARGLTRGDKVPVIYWDGKKYAETVKQVVSNNMLRIQMQDVPKTK